jgi:hypothetical protein
MQKMLPADSAKMQWDSGNKRWHIELQVGVEVIKRTLPKDSETAADEVLRSRAVELARDEGYELDAACVSVAR